jgi:hypothetical protein
MKVARPPGYQWAPLDLDTDPVPGDPTAVSQESAHLSGVAKTITDQITALRKIGSGGTDEVLKGKYADKLRSSANSLADQLGKIVGRYHTASSALSDYVPDLEHAQSMSLTALSDATGPAAQLSSLNGQTLPTGQNLTPAQSKQISDHKTALGKAQGALGDAKALLGKATSLRDSSASHCASRIHSAADDSMKDHWSLWGSIKDWVSAHAGWIKTICTILEVVGTILAVAAFILAQFVPGLDVLVDVLAGIAFGATLAAMLGRLVLASTGNGSWWDFGVDALSCLSFGTGRLLGAGLEAVAEGSEETARGLIAGERGLMLLKGEQTLSKAADLFDDQALCRITVKFMAKVDELVPDLAQAPESVSRLKWALSLGGFGDDAKNFARIYSVAARFPGTVADSTEMAEQFVKIMGISSGIAGGIGAFSLAGGGIVLGPHQDDPWVSLRIPDVSQWYDSTFEVPTGG